MQVLTNPGAHTGAPEGTTDFLCLLCFQPRRFGSQGRRPRKGSACTVKPNYFSVLSRDRSNILRGLTGSPSSSRRPDLGYSAYLCENLAGISGGSPNVEAFPYC